MRRTGIWLDQSQAVIISIDDQDQSQHINEFKSDIERFRKSTGGLSAPEPWMARSVRHDDKIARKIEQDLNRYYERIVDTIRDAAHLYIFGPGQAKADLKKYIDELKDFSPSMTIETTDRMTDRQMVARVREHFGIPHTEKQIVKNSLAS